MVKKIKESSIKKNLFLVLGVLVGVVVIFLVSDSLDYRDVMLNPDECTCEDEDDDPKVCLCIEITEPTECPYRQVAGGGEDDDGNPVVWWKGCVRNDDPKSDQKCHEECDNYFCHPDGPEATCCKVTCGYSTFMNDKSFFNRSNKDKEAGVRAVLEAVGVIFNSGCAYNDILLSDEVSIGQCGDYGCYTCAGAFTRENMYLAYSLGRTFGGFTISGGSEKWIEVDNELEVVHEPVHHEGNAFDTSLGFAAIINGDKDTLDDVEFFKKYGFTEGSIRCLVPPEKPDHTHCDVGSVSEVLDCSAAVFTHEDF